MRRIAKVDSFQSEAVSFLRQIGASVQSLAQLGGGVPDLLVSHHNKLYLFELKSLTGRLTTDQVLWHNNWKGTVYIVHTTDEILEVLNACTRF